MAWRHRMAIIVLFAFTGVPVGETVCASVCDSASTHAAAHHAADRECAEHSRSSSGPRMSAASEHDCSTHAATMEQVATAAEKTGLSARFAPALDNAASPGERVPLHGSSDSFDHTAPPGTAPPTARPAVLRV